MGREKERNEVVAAYVKGRGSFRELESKYGISASTIHRWVRDHEAGRKPIRKRKEPDGQALGQALTVKETEMSADVRRLRKELEEARLYNRLLNAMIDIAEDQIGIDIRKKPGAKRR